MEVAWAHSRARGRAARHVLPTLLWAAVVGGSAQAAQPDLSGFWFHKYDPATDSRSSTGNFREGYVPDAALKVKPAAPAQASAPAGPRDVVSHSARWCLAHPYPFFIRSAEGFSIVQGRKEVLVSGDRSMAMRHIYLDQPAHPQGWRPSIMGHAIGRWEGDTLVAETVGLAEGSIPGALQVTPGTRLVERYRLLTDGRLAVRFTWTDPSMLLKPHTYEFYYDRLPPETYSLEDWCDASDPAQHEEPYAAPSSPQP